MFALTWIGHWSPQFANDSGNEFYAALVPAVTLPFMNDHSFTIKGSAGHTWVEDNTRAGIPDFWNWSGGLGTSWDKLSFGLMYHDTDVDEANCNDNCGEKVVFNVAYDM